MKVKVHMLAFMSGEIREVDVPQVELEGDSATVSNEPDVPEDLTVQSLLDVIGRSENPVPVNKILNAVFYSGQNDFQPSNKLCSVSAGDVIELDGRFWQVADIGFKEMSLQEFEKYKKMPQSERAFSSLFAADPVEQ